MVFYYLSFYNTMFPKIILLMVMTGWTQTNGLVVDPLTCKSCISLVEDIHPKCSEVFFSDIFEDWITDSRISNGSISINSCNISNFDQMFPTTHLKQLDLSNNFIVSISPNVFSNLQSMETLILSYNNIVDLDPGVFKGSYMEGDLMPLRALKLLRLDHNKIQSLDQDLFEHVSRLEVLDLSWNPLKVINHHTVIAITSLTQLKILDMSYTQIKTLPTNFMHTPLYLETLNLTGNLFESIPGTLGQSHNLINLYIDNNPIVELTNVRQIPIIPTLKVLHMSYMADLLFIGKQSLSGLYNLEELVISNNPKLSEIDSAALTTRRNGAEYETWPPLKKLHLQGNGLTGLDMHFVRWDGLSELDISDNKFICDCKNQWMVNNLIPKYLKIDEELASELRCANPIEMEKFTLFDLYIKKDLMRCLDYYGNRPERDGIVLVAILAGILTTISLISIILYAYRTWSTRIPGYRLNYSRAFSNDQFT